MQCATVEAAIPPSLRCKSHALLIHPHSQIIMLMDWGKTSGKKFKPSFVGTSYCEDTMSVCFLFLVRLSHIVTI